MYLMIICHHTVDQWWAAAAAELSTALLDGFRLVNSLNHTAITTTLFHPTYPQMHGPVDL